MSNQHTQGEWKVSKNVYKQPVVYREIDAKNNDIIAIIDTGFSDIEIEANARLIAAAPKLLEAAQKLLSILGAAKILDGSDGYNVKAMMQMGHLKAACAAAKGE